MSYYAQHYQAIPFNYTAVFYWHQFLGDIKGRILDVGCSAGTFLRVAPPQTIGIDIDFDSLKIAKSRGYKVSRQDICRGTAFPDNMFSAIHMHAVLEHLREPFLALKECQRILQPGGRLICLTPDIMRWKFTFWRDDYTHIRPFGRQSLSMLAYDVGFKNIEIVEEPRYVKGSKRLGFEWGFRICKLAYRLGWRNYANIILVAVK
jgi:SAM-dependent methyltransferase